MRNVLFLFRFRLRRFFTGRHTLAETLDTTTSRLALLLTCVNGVAHPADFDRHFLHGGRDEKYSTARRARGFGVCEDLRVNSFLHCGRSVAVRTGEARQESEENPFLPFEEDRN